MNLYRQPSGHPSSLSRNRWAYAEYETEASGMTAVTVKRTLMDFREFNGLYSFAVLTHEYIPLLAKFQWISVWAIDYQIEPIELTISALDSSGSSTNVEMNMYTAVGYPALNQFARVKLRWPYPHNTTVFYDTQQQNYTVDNEYVISHINTSTNRKFMMRLGILWKPWVQSASIERMLFPHHRSCHSRHCSTRRIIRQFDRGRSARRYEEQDPHRELVSPSISQVDNDTECDASFSSPSSSDESFEMI